MINYRFDNSIVNKIIIIIMAAFACSNTFALDLKLKCNITTKFTYPSGQTESNSSIAIVEISEVNNNRWIFISSPDENANDIVVMGVNLTSGSAVHTGSDNSDEGKWDITTNVADSSKNTNSTNRIFIDRSSGAIIVSRRSTLPQNKTVLTTIGGSCEKIDEQKKKF